MAQTGQLRGRVGEEQLISLLEQVSGLPLVGGNMGGDLLDP